MGIVAPRVRVLFPILILALLPMIGRSGATAGASPVTVRAPALSPPVVLSISPTSGPTLGGTVLTVGGQNLLDTQYVDFDGHHVAPSSVTMGTLVVVTPAHAAGVVHVRVKTSGNELSAPTTADDFLFVDPPTVTSATPGQGSSAGGTVVTVHGVKLASTSQVLFGDVPVAPSHVTDTAVTVSSPPHPPGIVHIRVRTDGGLSATSFADQFAYIGAGPAISGVDPSSGPTSGGTFVTIGGTGFSGASAVAFGDDHVAPTSVSDSQIGVIAPPHAAGVVHIRVIAPSGASPATAADTYTYIAGLPLVLGIAPRGGPVTGGTTVTITGAGLSGAIVVAFGDQLVVPTSVTDTQIVVVAPPHAAGVVHLRVTTLAGPSPETALDDFTYGGGLPEVLSIWPTSGSTSGGTRITITGAGFAGTLLVLIGTQSVVPSAVSATEVVVIAPPHACGVVHLRVMTGAGLSPETPWDNFTYCGLPMVAGVAPTVGTVAGGTPVVISGSGFTTASAVSFGDVSVPPSSVTDSTIWVVSPAVSRPGVVHLRVTNDAGISPETEADNFTFVATPFVTGVSPRRGSTTGGYTVTITGAGFTGVTAVNFGGVGVIPTLVTDTEIRVLAPSHPTGTVHLRVTSPSGTSPETQNDDFTFTTAGQDLCPEIPLWVNDLGYGSVGGGFWYDPVSGMVWTGERGPEWHLFRPFPPRRAPQPLWVNAITYGSRGLGFYWDPVSGLVWTAERGWHLYGPTGCVPR